MTQNIKTKLTYRIKLCLWIMITGLALSGITAFPIETELEALARATAGYHGAMHNWLNTVYKAVRYTNHNYPYLSYGTDWLAFAHLLLAILFIGPLKDPFKNSWVIEFGMIAAIAIFPLAFIAGEIRGIPVFWRLIDCSFGIISLTVLLPCYKMIRKIEAMDAAVYGVF
ncbi:MAG TPA: hypothetical protein VGM63_07800 [Mucilaginibacter sp.]